MTAVKSVSKRSVKRVAKVAQPEGVAASPSSEGTAKTIVITNNQRRSWIVPRNLMGAELLTTNNIVHPGCSIEVSKDAFDLYYKYVEGFGKNQKGSKVFASMIDNKLLKASSKKAKIDMRDLEDAQPCTSEGWDHLSGDGKVKHLQMQKTPVTMTLEKSAAK